MDRVAVAKELVDIAKELDERYEETGNQKYLRLSNAVTDTLKEVVAEHKAMQRAAQGVGENFGRRVDQYGKGVRDWGRGVSRAVGDTAQQYGQDFMAGAGIAGQAIGNAGRAVGNAAQQYGQEFVQGAEAAGQAVGNAGRAVGRVPGQVGQAIDQQFTSEDEMRQMLQQMQNGGGGADPNASPRLLALQRQYGQLVAQMRQLPPGSPQAAQIQQQLMAIRAQGQQLRQQQNWPPNPAINRPY